MLAVTVMPINPKSKNSSGWKFEKMSCINFAGEELYKCLETKAYSTQDIFYLTVNPNSEGVPATHLSEGGGTLCPPLVNTVLMAQTS